MIGHPSLFIYVIAWIFHWCSRVSLFIIEFKQNFGDTIRSKIWTCGMFKPCFNLLEIFPGWMCNCFWPIMLKMICNNVSAIFTSTKTTFIYNTFLQGRQKKLTSKTDIAKGLNFDKIWIFCIYIYIMSKFETFKLDLLKGFPLRLQWTIFSIFGEWKPSNVPRTRSLVSQYYEVL